MGCVYLNICDEILKETDFFYQNLSIHFRDLNGIFFLILNFFSATNLKIIPQLTPFIIITLDSTIEIYVETQSFFNLIQ